MYKLFVLAVVVATAQAGVVPALPANVYAAGLQGYAGLPIAHATLPYAAPIAAPVAAPVLAKTVAAPAVVAPVAKTYAVPAPRTIEEAPIVEQIPEKVEQHGYSIRY
jgi:hypothetical protein